MAMITVYQISGLNTPREEAAKLLNTKVGDAWLSAKESKYSRYEIFIQYFYYEDIEEQIKKVFQENEELLSILKQNGKTRVLKRVICFISYLTNTLEVYRGPDKITEQIAKTVEAILGVKLKQLSLKGEDLVKLYKQHGIELKQAMFKHVDGLMYETLRGNMLEANAKFREYIKKFVDSLRVISFKPNIKYLNGGRYQVTVNGDKGTIRFSDSAGFKWRPRVEIRQLVFLLAVTAGILG